MAKFSTIKPNQSSDKTTYTECNPVLRSTLRKWMRKLRINRKKAQKLARIIRTKNGNVRKAVYEFHLGRGCEVLGYKNAKQFVDSERIPRSDYFPILRLAKIEINIKPHGKVGKTNEAILKEIARLGEPTLHTNNKQHNLHKLHRHCWIAAKKIARQHVTLEVIREVVDDHLLFM